jgi:choline kinase
MSAKKILIAIPTARHIEPSTFKSIYNLELPDNCTAEFDYFSTYQLDETRNLIAKKSKEFDYLFCIDSDIVLEKDSLKRLFSHNKDIVSGLYVKKNLDKTEYEIYDKINGRFKVKTVISKDLFEIHGCGFGCVLLKTSVFDQIEYPYFKNTFMSNEEPKSSEDLYFCRKAKVSGFQLWADPAVLCGHIGLHVYK